MPTQEDKARRAELLRAAGFERDGHLSKQREALLASRNPQKFRRPSFFVTYACFACRKSFKRKPAEDRAVLCPQCGGEAAAMGRSFKAPAMSELKQWRKVERLWQEGYRFHTNTQGSIVPPYPAELRDVDQFIADYPRHPFRLRAFWPEDDQICYSDV